MYQISRQVRDVCTFARQNIAADAPFSRLDLISCRNVLIYLGPELHRRCVPQFHYALLPDGLLILGPAESVGPFENLFKMVDKKNKIYAKKNVPSPQLILGYARHDVIPGATPAAIDLSTSGQLLQTADRIMLNAYAPAAVVLDSEMLVQQFRGRADAYLAHPAGPASLNIFQLAQPSLVSDLRTALHHAGKTKKTFRKERALVKVDGKMREINIQVVPFKVQAAGKFWYLVIFDETTKGARPGVSPQLLGKTLSAPNQGRNIGITARRRDASTRPSLIACLDRASAPRDSQR